MKKNFESIDQILEFAINREQEAVDFYTDLSSKIERGQIKEVFKQFAFEEVSHKAKLQKIKDENIIFLQKENIIDLKIGDYIESIHPTDNMEYQDALILAMKREKAAFKLYTKLAERMESPQHKELFSLLAQEESKHKLRFEIEYDEYIMRDN